ncbi:MAG: hypothetical protein ACJAXT_001739 [Paracoccaceae bacterium]|jgi:hypothetical protein
MFRLTALILTLALSTPAFAQEAEPSMTPERLAGILLVLDAEAQTAPGQIQLSIADVPVLVVMDVAANRMRAMVPIASADQLTDQDLARMMQANFDTALDARYAIAQGRIWGVFIHPLAELEREQLISGIAQTVNLARTYGTLYSGGAIVFGGGDSSGLYQDLFEELLERGQDI